jgi:FkbM family methyltransferase
MAPFTLPFRRRTLRYYNTPTHNDRWVVDLFAGKRGGFFVEAGALDGIGGSCTYALERYLGWTGILVEPGLSFPALRRNRRRSICEAVCLSNRPGLVTFVDAQESGYSGIKDVLLAESARHLARWGKPREQWRQGAYGERTVAAVTLHDLLIRHQAPPIIEYVALDLEGAEFQVLRDFPFDRYRILTLSIEGDACHELLLARGYRATHNPYNQEAPWEHYYVHPDLELSPARLSRE